MYTKFINRGKSWEEYIRGHFSWYRYLEFPVWARTDNSLAEYYWLLPVSWRSFYYCELVLSAQNGPASKRNSAFPPHENLRIGRYDGCLNRVNSSDKYLLWIWSASILSAGVKILFQAVKLSKINHEHGSMEPAERNGKYARALYPRYSAWNRQ